MTDVLLKGLKAVVQFRRKDGGHPWQTMAAFDLKTVAESYCKRLSDGDRPWEYQVVDLITADQ